MNLSDHQALFTLDVGRLLAYRVQGYRIRLDQAARLPEWQEMLVRDGDSWTMNSDHLERLAIDLILDWWDSGRWVWVEGVDRAWRILANYWCSLSPQNYWGGMWSKGDYGHFGRKKTVEEAEKLRPATVTNQLTLNV